MPILTFPFIVIRPGDLARPYVPVTLINPDTKRNINVYALIDTGADECALPASFAGILEHRLESGVEKQISTGNGITTAYGHTTIIDIDEFSTGPITVDYMPNLPIPLLGTRSFLSTLILTVNYPEKLISLEYTDK